jgi:hypothetical protein
MAASKDTFEPHVFASRAFAAGVFRGVGVDVEPSEPKYPGGMTFTRDGLRSALARDNLACTFERGGNNA